MKKFIIFLLSFCLLTPSYAFTIHSKDLEKCIIQTGVGEIIDGKCLEELGFENREELERILRGNTRALGPVVAKVCIWVTKQVLTSVLVTKLIEVIKENGEKVWEKIQVEIPKMEEQKVEVCDDPYPNIP